VSIICFLQVFSCSFGRSLRSGIIRVNRFWTFSIRTQYGNWWFPKFSLLFTACCLALLRSLLGLIRIPGPLLSISTTLGPSRILVLHWLECLRGLIILLSRLLCAVGIFIREIFDPILKMWSGPASVVLPFCQCDVPHCVESLWKVQGKDTWTNRFVDNSVSTVWRKAIIALWWNQSIWKRIGRQSKIQD